MANPAYEGHALQPLAQEVVVASSDLIGPLGRGALAAGGVQASTANLMPSPEELHRKDEYIHLAFTEADSREFAEDAWRIQAESYFDSGFVGEDAITTEGFLVPELDKSRGPHTEYHMAIDPANGNNRATMRIVNVPPGGTYRDLPSYNLCKDALTPEGQALLQGVEDPEARLKDLSALARTHNMEPQALYEIMRTVVQGSLGKNEVWFFAAVSKTHAALARRLGKDNLTVIGTDVAMNDERVKENITLRPSVVFPDKFIDTMLDAYVQSGGKDRKLRESFIFFTEGLTQDQMSERAFAMRQELLKPKAA